MSSPEEYFSFVLPDPNQTLALKKYFTDLEKPSIRRTDSTGSLF